jgi:hypothetical protein
VPLKVAWIQKYEINPEFGTWDEGEGRTVMTGTIMKTNKSIQRYMTKMKVKTMVKMKMARMGTGMMRTTMKAIMKMKIKLKWKTKLEIVARYPQVSQ